jgi:hypothetical protein
MRGRSLSTKLGVKYTHLIDPTYDNMLKSFGFAANALRRFALALLFF